MVRQIPLRLIYTAMTHPLGYARPNHQGSTGSSVDGNDITLSLDVPENQVKDAYGILSNLISQLKE